MKRFFITGILSIILLSSLVPFLVLAQEGPLNCCRLGRDVIVEGTTFNEGSLVGSPTEECHLGTVPSSQKTKKWSLICLISSIKVATDWIFTFLMVFVSLMVILGAYTITSAAGSPDKINKGRNYIFYAIIGFIIGIFSRAIPELVSVLLGI